MTKSALLVAFAGCLCGTAVAEIGASDIRTVTSGSEMFNGRLREASGRAQFYVDGRTNERISITNTAASNSPALLDITDPNGVGACDDGLVNIFFGVSSNDPAVGAAVTDRARDWHQPPCDTIVDCFTFTFSSDIPDAVPGDDSDFTGVVGFDGFIAFYDDDSGTNDGQGADLFDYQNSWLFGLSQLPGIKTSGINTYTATLDAVTVTGGSGAGGQDAWFQIGDSDGTVTDLDGDGFDDGVNMGCDTDDLASTGLHPFSVEFFFFQDPGGDGVDPLAGFTNGSGDPAAAGPSLVNPDLGAVPSMGTEDLLDLYVSDFFAPDGEVDNVAFQDAVPDLAAECTALDTDPALFNPDSFCWNATGNFGGLTCTGVASTSNPYAAFELSLFGTGEGPTCDPSSPCSAADLAQPFCTLNFADVQAFLGNFGQGLPPADLAAPSGVFNFADVQTFLGLFGSGC